MRDLKVPCVHEDGFHQTAPQNYHPTVLGNQDLVSFHKYVTECTEHNDDECTKTAINEERSLHVYREHLGVGTISAAERKVWAQPAAAATKDSASSAKDEL